MSTTNGSHGTRRPAPPSAPMATTRAAVLDGIRVVDFSRIFAGPLCTMTLGDLGADVLKVESPTGDEARGFGPPSGRTPRSPRTSRGPRIRKSISPLAQRYPPAEPGIQGSRGSSAV